MTDAEAFRWIEARTCRRTALGCHLAWVAHRKALAAGVEGAAWFGWMRDARDFAAALGLEGAGRKWRRWDLAADLIKEGGAPEQLVLLTRLATARAREEPAKPGKPPLQPLQAMRNDGAVAFVRKARKKGRSAKDAYDAAARVTGLGPVHIRRLYESAMPSCMSRRGRRKR